MAKSTASPLPAARCGKSSQLTTILRAIKPVFLDRTWPLLRFGIFLDLEVIQAVGRAPTGFQTQMRGILNESPLVICYGQLRDRSG